MRTLVYANDTTIDDGESIDKSNEHYGQTGFVQHVLAFRVISPLALTQILIIPKIRDSLTGLSKDQVKVANTKRKSGEEGSSTTIENDELTQVFGKDHGGRLRGIGSHISKKQMVIVEIGKAKEATKKKEKAKGDALKDEMLSLM
ncbi:hypothetical protein LguiA_033566 [Lonicera macranthoides]